MTLERGKVYKWSDIVSAYPDMWAFVTDVKKDEGAIQTGKLLDIVPFERKSETYRKYKSAGVSFYHLRTTFAAPNVGVLY